MDDEFTKYLGAGKEGIFAMYRNNPGFFHTHHYTMLTFIQSDVESLLEHLPDGPNRDFISEQIKGRIDGAIELYINVMMKGPEGQN